MVDPFLELGDSFRDISRAVIQRSENVVEGDIETFCPKALGGCREFAVTVVVIAIIIA